MSSLPSFLAGVVGSLTPSWTKAAGILPSFRSKTESILASSQTEAGCSSVPIRTRVMKCYSMMSGFLLGSS